jgi:hypothetical protein
MVAEQANRRWVPLGIARTSGCPPVRRVCQPIPFTVKERRESQPYYAEVGAERSHTYAVGYSPVSWLVVSIAGMNHPTPKGLADRIQVRADRMAREQDERLTG